MAPPTSTLVDALATAVSTARRISAHLRFDPSNPTQLYAVSLYLTIIEYANAMILVQPTSSIIILPLVTRAAIDVYVDIENLAADPTFHESLQLTDELEWKKVLQRASGGDNPFLRSLFNDDAIMSEGRESHDRAIAELKERGVRTHNARDRYTRVGREQDYEAVYAGLSADVHNGISAVFFRHFDSDSSAQNLTILTPPRARFGESCLIYVTHALVHSSDLLLKICGHGSAANSDGRAALEGIAAKT